jgi:predicted nucleotidyltransferase
MRTLISSKKRKNLLRLLLDDPEERMGIRAAARACHLSPASVSVFVASLEKEGMFRRGRPDVENPELRALKTLFNIEKVAPLFTLVKRKFDAKGMGVYGSWAKGTNTSASDLDLWIMLDKEPTPSKTAEIRQCLREATGTVDISIVFLTKQKLDVLRKKDSVFYSMLFHSYYIGGEKID